MKNYTITVNGNVYDVVVEEGQTTGAPVAAKAPAAPKAAPAAGGAAGSIKVEAGAAGKVFKIDAAVGTAVKKGDAVDIKLRPGMGAKLIIKSDQETEDEDDLVD